MFRTSRYKLSSFSKMFRTSCSNLCLRFKMFLHERNCLFVQETSAKSRAKQFCPGLTHREPLLEEADFARFVATVEPLMKWGRDVLWVMTGRTDSNLPKIKKILRAQKMNFEAFYLCYNTKQMQQYGHWKRQRGPANSKSLEQALYVYKGRVPKNMPKNRMFVDAGSPLFNQVVKNVPVLAPKHQAFVCREVRETSLQSMAGVPHDEDAEEQEKITLTVDVEEGLNQPEEADAKDAQTQVKELVAQVKKRKLYRQLSGTEVPWFPHDNAMELLREFCWEAGSPRWVIHGTPAGGAGVHGCLEAGCSVVALCYDEHHRTELNKFFLERAVEAMVSGQTLVFKDDALQARSVELNLTTKAKPEKPPEKDEKTEKDSTVSPKKKQGEKAKKKKKEEKAKKKEEKAKKKKAKVTETEGKAKVTENSDADSSDSGSDDDSDSASEAEPPAKKPKKG